MNCKVIVVGGGPVGLVAAHALHLAGIDFVLLEKRDSVIEDTGASVVLAPPSLRILSQFGLREKLETAGAELQHAMSFTREGYKFRDSTQIKLLKECLGSAQLIFHRPDLVQIIYEGLPPAAKEKVLIRKKVTGVEENEDAVSVTCADGSTFVGSVVIGADGVYSRTRQQMRQAMLRQGLQANCDEEQPFKSAYRMLWCTFPRPISSSPGDACETQDKDRSLGYLAGKERGWIFLYEKLEKPTRERVEYSEKDIEHFAASFFDYPISESLLFKDVFQGHKAGMANMGEGVVKNFSNNRTVLAGDACHRFTPNAALGLNNGIQDIVAICNGIHAAFRSSKDRILSRAALQTAFDRYRNQRLAPIQKDLRASALLTRLQAWANTWFYIFARFLLVFDWFQKFTLRYVAVPNMRLAPVLDYVSADEPYVGTVAWAHPINPRKEPKEY